MYVYVCIIFINSICILKNEGFWDLILFSENDKYSKYNMNSSSIAFWKLQQGKCKSQLNIFFLNSFVKIVDNKEMNLIYNPINQERKLM